MSRDDPLSLGQEEMRRMAHTTLDMLIDFLNDAEADPVLRRATPEEMEVRVPGAASDGGQPFEQLLEVLRSDVLPYGSRTFHPRYFAFIPGGGTFPGVLGDLIASAANIEASSWMEAAGPARLELIVIDWFKDWIGYPAEAAGVLVSAAARLRT